MCKQNSCIICKFTKNPSLYCSCWCVWVRTADGSNQSRGSITVGRLFLTRGWHQNNVRSVVSRAAADNYFGTWLINPLAVESIGFTFSLQTFYHLKLKWRCLRTSSSSLLKKMFARWKMSLLFWGTLKPVKLTSWALMTAVAGQIWWCGCNKNFWTFLKWCKLTENFSNENWLQKNQQKRTIWLYFLNKPTETC